MNAKRSTHVTNGIQPNDTSAARSVPAGAMLAPELVLQQLAFEAEAMSIMWRAGDNRDRR
jgi:hypothetical protein